MTGLAFIQDLAIVMAASAVTTLLCYWVRLPSVLGYILAGLFIGPHTPPFSLVSDAKSIETLANLGVIFLMFSIGLEFSLKKLKRLGFTALIATTLEVLLMISIGFSVGKLLGWGLMDSLFLGALLSISSTTIIATVLIEAKLIKERFAQVVIAILIMEDLLAILIIAILSALAITGTVTLQNISYSMLKVAIFILLTVIGGVLTVPRLIGFVSRIGISQIMIVLVLGLCFGFALLGAKLGFSLALGSFLIGAVIAESSEAKDIIRKIEPLRDMFIAIFFVSVGMLLDPSQALRYGFAILIITAAVIIGKYSCVSFAVFLTGNEARTSMMAGLCLTQIGEFSFIMAQLGESVGVTRQSLFPIAVSVSMVSSFFSPILIHQRENLASRLGALVPKPLVTFAEFYTSWLKPLESKAAYQPKRGLIPALLYFILMAGIFAVAFHWAGRVTWNPVLYWLCAGLLIFPFWVGLIHSLDDFFWHWFVAGRSQKTLSSQLMRNMFRIGILIVFALIVLVVSFPFLPRIPVLLFLGAILSFASLGFWALITRFHAHLESTLKLVFSEEAKETEPREKSKERLQLEQLIKEEYPWEVSTEEVIVPYKQTAANQPIRDLKLPQITGAMVMAIYREEGSLVNPPPETLVMPGDVLVLMGEKEQVASGIRYLSELMSKPIAALGEAEPQALKVIIRTSGVIGKTLAQLSIRSRSGASIIGIQKGDGLSITNPPPYIQLEAGDTVILFGTKTEIEKARKILLDEG